MARYRRWKCLPPTVQISIDTNEQRPWRLPDSVYVYAPRCRYTRDLVHIQIVHESLQAYGVDYAIRTSDTDDRTGAGNDFDGVVVGVERKGSESEIVKNMLTRDYRRTKKSLEKLRVSCVSPWLILDMPYPQTEEGLAAAAGFLSFASYSDVKVLWLHTSAGKDTAGRVVASLMLSEYAGIRSLWWWKTR